MNSESQAAPGPVPRQSTEYWASPRLRALDDLNMRRLRYFMMVAAKGSISAAAEALVIAQPSLSQQMLRLESMCGGTLFTRGSSGVSLTRRGAELEAVLTRTFQEVTAVVAARDGVPEPLRIGVCAGVGPDVLAMVVEAVGGEAPRKRSIAYRPADSSSQYELLSRRELDFALTRQVRGGRRGFVQSVVADEALGVVVGASHPLAGRAGVGWTELVDQNLLWFDERRAPQFAHELLSTLRAAGWDPTLVPAPADRHSVFAHLLTSSRDLVALRPAHAVASGSSLRWIPLLGGAPRERITLVALGGGRAGMQLRAVAQAWGWKVASL